MSDPLSSRKAIIALIDRLLRDDFDTEAAADEALRRLKRSVPDPNISDLIFWTDEGLDAEAVYEKAMRYRPIVCDQGEGAS